MKKSMIIVAMFAAQFAWAHGDHPPRVAKCAAACSKEEISAGAKSALMMIAAKDPKKAQFADAELKSVELKDFAKGKEWVAQFTKPNLPEGKRDLFVFITTDGTLNGSNLTGK